MCVCVCVRVRVCGYVCSCASFNEFVCIGQRRKKLNRTLFHANHTPKYLYILRHTDWWLNITHLSWHKIIIIIISSSSSSSKLRCKHIFPWFSSYPFLSSISLTTCWVLTELMLKSSCWSVNTSASMCGGPQKIVTFEFALASQRSVLHILIILLRCCCFLNGT